MSHILLLGAGFSRNWGGWLGAEVFEYLLGCPEIARDESLRTVMWKCQATGGFESALEQVQAAHRSNPAQHQPRLDALQAAIGRMFVDMNRAFFDVTEFEFQNSQERSVKKFLTKFDAIFTLNQDVLIEHRYKDEHDLALTDPRRWNGLVIPGMQRIAPTEPIYGSSWARAIWVPQTAGEYVIEPRSQPLFKLHGSSNWRDRNGGAMLVMGGQKAREINLHPILSTYAREFENRLNTGNAKLMVIGYGFRDDHINAVISSAVLERGLRIFVVSPEGSEQARYLNHTRQRGQIIAPTPLEEVFERGLIGASRRPLNATFGGDTAEFNKVQRFFE